MKADAYTGLSNYTETIRKQYELQLSTYDQAITNLLSDKDFLIDIRTLCYLKRTEDNTLALEKAYRHVSEKISNYSNLTDFYRVNVITSNDDFLTNDMKLSSFNKEAIENLEKLLQNSDVFKGTYLVPKFQDIWLNSEQYLFSYVREVNYSNDSKVYIQVEDEQKNLESLVNLNTDTQISFYIVDSADRIVAYSENGDLIKLQHYLELEREEINFEGSLVYKTKLENGQRVVAFQELTAVNSAIWSTSFYLILFSVILLILMYLIFRNQLNKILNPLEDLKVEMENLSIATLPESSMIRSEENEIAALSDSYNGLKTRLNQSIENELIAQRKQFEANMEVLQAQIDPHFIYNIMNIVAYKGIEYDDVDTVEIAHGITEMLRYSTSNVEKHATFKDEFTHVENYLLLMKKRYQNMLSYEIHLPDSYKNILIPKLVLQIFAENSIKYGFDAGKSDIHIQLSVTGSKFDEWKIEIKDDGPGITQDKLLYLRTKIAEINKTLADSQSLEQLDFEIGGLGIVNTYARLRLYYGEAFDLAIDTNNRGTRIILWKRKMNNGIDKFDIS